MSWGSPPPGSIPRHPSSYKPRQKSEFAINNAIADELEAMGKEEIKKDPSKKKQAYYCAFQAAKSVRQASFAITDGKSAMSLPFIKNYYGGKIDDIISYLEIQDKMKNFDLLDWLTQIKMEEHHQAIASAGYTTRELLANLTETDFDRCAQLISIPFAHRRAIVIECERLKERLGVLKERKPNLRDLDDEDRPSSSSPSSRTSPSSQSSPKSPSPRKTTRTTPSSRSSRSPQPSQPAVVLSPVEEQIKALKINITEGWMEKHFSGQNLHPPPAKISELILQPIDDGTQMLILGMISSDGQDATNPSKCPILINLVNGDAGWEVDSTTCDCPSFNQNGAWCIHQASTFRYIMNLQNPIPSSTPPKKSRPRKSPLSKSTPIPSHSDDGNNDDQDDEDGDPSGSKPKKRPRSRKSDGTPIVSTNLMRTKHGYCPRFRSGPWGILTALHQMTTYHASDDGFTKEDIVKVARPYSEASYTEPSPSNYTAWDGIANLFKNQKVEQCDTTGKIRLTSKGKELAADVVVAQQKYDKLEPYPRIQNSPNPSPGNSQSSQGFTSPIPNSYNSQGSQNSQNSQNSYNSQGSQNSQFSQSSQSSQTYSPSPYLSVPQFSNSPRNSASPGPVPSSPNVQVEDRNNSPYKPPVNRSLNLNSIDVDAEIPRIPTAPRVPTTPKIVAIDLDNDFAEIPNFVPRVPTTPRRSPTVPNRDPIDLEAGSHQSPVDLDEISEETPSKRMKSDASLIIREFMEISRDSDDKQLLPELFFSQTPELAGPAGPVGTMPKLIPISQVDFNLKEEPVMLPAAPAVSPFKSVPPSTFITPTRPPIFSLPSTLTSPVSPAVTPTSPAVTPPSRPASTSPMLGMSPAISPIHSNPFGQMVPDSQYSQGGSQSSQISPLGDFPEIEVSEEPLVQSQTTIDYSDSQDSLDSQEFSQLSQDSNSQSARVFDGFSPDSRQYGIQEGIILLMDTREQNDREDLYSRKIRGNLHKEIKESQDVMFESLALSVGDFAWISRSGSPSKKTAIVLNYIVERKTLEDLWKSINDGRLFDQKARLKSTGIQNIFFIIEGPSTHETFQDPIRKSQIEKALLDLSMDETFFVQRTRSESHTAEFLGNLTRFIRNSWNPAVMQTPHTLETFNTKFKKAKTKLKSYWAQHLLTLEDFRKKEVGAIVNSFPTPASLHELYRAQDRADAETCMRDLPYGRHGETLGIDKSKDLFYHFVGRNEAMPDGMEV